MKMVAFALALFLAPCAAWAQLTIPPVAVDLADYAKLADIPTPRLTVPPSEAVGGVAGTAGTYLPGNAQVPRMTRATTVTTGASGVFSGTWSNPFAVAPNVVLTPIYTGSGSVNCFLTATPTTTAFAGKCMVDQSALLSLSIVTTGLTVGPVAGSSGMSIQVLGIPPTQ